MDGYEPNYSHSLMNLIGPFHQEFSRHPPTGTTKWHCMVIAPNFDHSEAASQDLRRITPTVVDLVLTKPLTTHLQLLLAMPNLRRLEIHGNPKVGYDETHAQPAGHGSLLNLERLYADAVLGRHQLEYILKASAHSLKTLQVQVPVSGNYLVSLLERCGLKALKRLVLHRHGCGRAACTAQLAACRRVLPPGTAVVCDGCSDNVEIKFLCECKCNFPRNHFSHGFE